LESVIALKVGLVDKMEAANKGRQTKKETVVDCRLHPRCCHMRPEKLLKTQPFHDHCAIT